MLEKLRCCYARAQFSASAKFIYFVQEEFDDRCDLFLKDKAGVKVCKVIPLNHAFLRTLSTKTKETNYIDINLRANIVIDSLLLSQTLPSFRRCFSFHCIIGMQDLGVTLACNFIFYVSVVNNNNIIIIIILIGYRGSETY